MKGFLERLQNGGNIVTAEGYLWELQRRGFTQFGSFLPEVVLERPSAVRNLHEEFALAGSDVIQAYTYYAHREQLKRQGLEDNIEKLNRDALKMAREVANEHGKLMAGGLSNTPLYKPDDPKSHEIIAEMFKEQVEWAVEEGADFMIGETFNCFGEACLALEAIKKHGKGVPAVITLTAYFPDRTTDDVPFTEACKRLEELGADVVGINCARGPDIMLPLVKEIKAVCKGPVAALPVPYRTTSKQKTFQSLTDPKTGKKVYPENLDSVRCNLSDIRDFATAAKDAGIQYVGLCCGNAPDLTRELALVYGRNPPAAKYCTDHSKSFVFGDDTEHYGEEMLKLRKFMTGE